ncbi:ribosome silencing factor [Deinococcus peraridilitoris]|uniref:Ribosomal silencing factor RsfS n=1 Tax=Deinococcus peraridilitoris (strain DSM 19664 / LMG 22246 / CIP 109416 / KR-200) TaxID=937777 RepID=K9ZZD3_DEIPD|nr:ribosome silencing factor [Deinococcus peraridilitoris]AFZ66961.1 iojap-like ribosome-associated protein [Deinococcus peraridilitoris DSM 19664]
MPDSPVSGSTLDSATHTQLRAVVQAARERRAEDVTVLDLTHISSTLDYFVICTATAGLQLNAVQQNIREKSREVGLPQPSVEGPSERWLLLSFGSIVVHIMTREAREYYDLEGLWNDARLLEFPDDTQLS